MEITLESSSIRNKSGTCETGQSTVEFVLTMVLLLGFVLFFLQLSMVFSWGNYVHYATFMSARALQSAGESADDSTRRARDVLIRTVKFSAGQPGKDRFEVIGRGIAGSDDVKGADIGQFRGIQGEFQFNPDDKAKSWLEGVRYTFRTRLFLLPIDGDMTKVRDVDAPSNSLELTSESWLTRDPSFDECAQIMGGLGVFDNGC